MAIIDNQAWRDFIEAFRGEKILWEVKNENYKNKVKRDQSWQKLLENYKEIDSQATVDIVKKRINGMRNCYRRELSKIKKSERSGAGVEDIYEPTLWYFYQLNFLRDQELQASGRSTLDENENESDADSQSNRKRKGSEKNSEFLQKAIQHLDETKNRRTARDDADVFAESWAILFRKLSPEQQIYAKRGIDEILVHGQLGNLDVNSVKINITQRLPRPYTISRASTPYTSSSSISDPFPTVLTQVPQVFLSKNTMPRNECSQPVFVESQQYIEPNSSENSVSAQSFTELFTDTQYQ